MTRRNITNMAASVHARLKNKARALGRPYNELLQYYAMERFLYRLSQSPHVSEFVLKGALLLHTHEAVPTRPTRDIDLLGHGESSGERLTRVVRSCCEIEVPDDGIHFDPESVTSAEIRPEALYDGQRLKVTGYLGTARLVVQIDVGFGDAVVPGPIWMDYPELLDHGPPRLRAYTLESAVAEKYQAMVDLGAFNSRMKDFFDVWWLSRNKAFEGPRLAGAIEATFERRRTALPSDVPIALTEAFADRAAEEQWRAFLRRMRLEDGPPELRTVIEVLHAFLMPPTRALSEGRPFEAQWTAGGPWSEDDDL